MIPVFQTIVDKELGDCTRACIASILELPIDAVPNFARFPKNWYLVMLAFLRALDYDYYGTGFPHSHKIEEYTVKGFVIASVPSKTFVSVNHSIVIDSNGLCVHDPNPNKKWKDINVKETKDLQHWLLIDVKADILPRLKHVGFLSPIYYKLECDR